LRDAGTYAGSTINRTARLRDLAHGGQTVLSGAAEPLVIDRLPADCVADRPGRAPAAGSAAPGTGDSAQSFRPAQRLPSATHRE
jgi:class 3 adenylate cyclase